MVMVAMGPSVLNRIVSKPMHPPLRQDAIVAYELAVHKGSEGLR
jgi:hypothetical protein